MKKFKNGVIYYDDDLPRHMLHGKECIYWEKTVNTIMLVEYCGIVKKLKFIDYSKRYITFEIEGIRKTMCINSFYCKGNIQKIIANKSIVNPNWKYKIDEIIDVNNKQYLIINKKIIKKSKTTRNETYNSNEKWYNAQCLKCGYDGIWVREDTKLGCGCCNGKVLVKGINDIATTNPEIAQYFTYKEEAREHTKGEHIIINTTCPICSYKRDMNLSNVTPNKFSCPNCSDGFSYPEKFVLNIFEQLNEQYIYQLSSKDFEWCGKYRYDFYIKRLNKIIEVHGLQHYKTCTNFNDSETIKENDYQKIILAQLNGVEIITIDARYSDKNYIKDSILKSELNNLLNLNNINWDECDQRASGTIYEDIYRLYDTNKTINEIARDLHINKATVRKYIKRINNNEQ